MALNSQRIIYIEDSEVQDNLFSIIDSGNKFIFFSLLVKIHGGKSKSLAKNLYTTTKFHTCLILANFRLFQTERV